MPVINNQLQPAPVTLPTAATAATKGVNPAHGQPGHDCAVAVGAPLNAASVQNPSAVAPVPAPQQNVAPATSQPMPASPFNIKQPQLGGANVKAAGLNPAHGQLGHDCAVAVGQPLKR